MNPLRHTELLAALTAHGLLALDDSRLLPTHAGDWSDAPRVAPDLVVFPKSPAEVSSAVKLIAQAGRRVVIQGGLTGLAGAATPQKEEIAISLSKLNAIEHFDQTAGTVTVQAGVTLAQVQSHVEAEGWFFPLDLGARGSCQIGGNAATNAGGNRVLRYGTMRDRVLGLEVVLADGRLLTMMNQVTKNTTGVDLKHLFIGSEGTLGVITRLVLKLSPKPVSSNTALCALQSFDQATRLLRHLQEWLPTLAAYELMWADYMAAATRITCSTEPFGRPYPIYVLVETLGQNEISDKASLEQALERALEEELTVDVVVAQSLADANKLWTYREAVGELLSTLKPHAAFDVGIPMSAMDDFVTSTRHTLIRLFPDQHHLFFGHIGDGNLHLLSGPYASADLMHGAEQVVYSAVRDSGGCISAEHGIGTVKKGFLQMSRSPEELALMRSLKQLLDPVGVLNVGRILEMDAGS